MLRLLIALATLACLLLAPKAHAQALTYTAKYESKLFINTIPQADCASSSLTINGVLATPATHAAFIAFCNLTNLGENPPDGATPTPLDARIRGDVTLSFVCQVGNALPVAPASVTAGPTAAGIEGPAALGILGALSPTGIRDQLIVNGGWGYVLSGRPNALVEPPFQRFQVRLNRHIWHRLAGTVACGVDARGLPTATITHTLSRTWFPSHKVWYLTPATAARPGALTYNRPQRSFEDLWTLPVVGAP